MTATGLLGAWVGGCGGCCAAMLGAGEVDWGPEEDRLNGIMESVWKLMGGLGAILSICWMPAWMALSSVSRPSKSSMAWGLTAAAAGAAWGGTAAAPAPAPPTFIGGKEAALAPPVF